MTLPSEVPPDLSVKLSKKNDFWTGSSIYPKLTPDILQAIKKSFLELLPGVKLKLLLSFLYMPERMLQLWLEDLEEILEVAVADGDQWVAVTAEFLQPFPRKGTVNLRPEENGLVLRETAEQLTAVHAHGDLLGMEVDYLNPAALAAQTSQSLICQKQQHFALRRATKAETLRKHLLERARDAATQVEKRTAGGTPKSHRICGSAPSKTSYESSNRDIFSSASSSSSSRNSSSSLHTSKEGKIKLLDISELPSAGDKESKRRRSQKVEELAKIDTNNSYYPPTFLFEELNNATYPFPQYTNGSNYPAYQPNSPMFQNYGQVSHPQGPMIYPPQPNQEFSGGARYSYPGNQPSFYPGAPNGFYYPIPGEPQNRGTFFQGPTSSMGQPPPGMYGGVRQATARRTVKKKFMYDPQEKMIEVLQLFKYANRASYKEKAFILSFIAGFRTNPCPELGPVYSIKVHEEQEVFSQQDGSMLPLLGDTLVQLNYDTGEVKTVKVYRSLAPASPQPPSLIQPSL